MLCLHYAQFLMLRLSVIEDRRTLDNGIPTDLNPMTPNAQPRPRVERVRFAVAMPIKAPEPER